MFLRRNARKIGIPSSMRRWRRRSWTTIRLPPSWPAPPAAVGAAADNPPVPEEPESTNCLVASGSSVFRPVFPRWHIGLVESIYGLFHRPSYLYAVQGFGARAAL